MKANGRLALLGLVGCVGLVSLSDFGSENAGKSQANNESARASAVALSTHSRAGESTETHDKVESAESGVSIMGRLKDPEVIARKTRAVARRARQSWEAEFPWQPISVSRDSLSSGGLEGALAPSDRSRAIRANHQILERFFQDESRHSKQFEQLYEILEAHGRGDNPALAAAIFTSLRKYHDNQDESWSESILGHLTRWEWFLPENGTSEGQVRASELRDRIVSEIGGMEELPADVMDYALNRGTHSSDTEGKPQSRAEETLLVPNEQWLAKSAEWWSGHAMEELMELSAVDPFP